MACELTPKHMIRTYPDQAPEVQVCEFLQEWKPCDCCPNGFAGYDKTDGPYTYCLNGKLMIAEPLTDTKNCDDPQKGSHKVNPTWKLFSLSQWLRSKQDQLVDAEGNKLDDAACVATCEALEGVRNELLEKVGLAPIYKTVSELVASTYTGYEAGDVVNTSLDDFTYTVAPTTASDAHLVTAVGTKLYVQPNQDGNFNVKAFNPNSTNGRPAFLAAALAAEAVQNGAYQSPQVIVPTGSYVVGSPIGIPTTWAVQPGANIGQGTVAPTQEPNLTNLTGTVIKLDGVGQYNTLSIGDPAQRVQVLTGKGFTAEIQGRSDNAAGGLAGLTYSSARPQLDGSTIGVTAVAINDTTDDSKTVWGVYSEAYRLPGTTGNAFGQEITMFNSSDVIKFDPFQIPNFASGVTVASWLSAGGTYTGVTGTNDATAAIGIIEKSGAKFDKGIVIMDGSVRSQEAIALPINYEMNWYGSSNVKAARIRNDRYEQVAINANNLIESTRVNPGDGAVQNGDRIFTHNYIASNNGIDYKLAEQFVAQDSVAAANGAAAGRWSVAVKDAAGADQPVTLRSTDFSPNDNIMPLGHVNSRRWSGVNTISGTSVVSDEREISALAALSVAEMAVATRLKDEVRVFTYTGANSDGKKHVGFSAQTIINVFALEGLNALDYGIIVRENDKYGVVTSQLLAFIIAAM